MTRPASERGSGLVSTLAGVTVVLAFLFLATQVLVNLYATSTVTAAADEAAHLLARDPGASCERAGARVRQRLGSYAATAGLAVTCSARADAVSVRVVATNPRLTLGGLAASVPFSTIDRTATVRLEVER